MPPRCRAVTILMWLERSQLGCAARRYTEASLRELAASLGLSRADSVPNLTRRLEGRLKASPHLADELAEIMTPLVDYTGRLFREGKAAISRLLFITVHVKYREITPILLSGVLGLLMALIAYGRMVLKPIY